MDLITIKQDTNWSDAADASNNNFLKIKLEVEKISLATNKHKGFFNTLAGLKGAYPTPTVGDNAWVGATYPGLVHDCITRGVWRATATVPLTGSVNLADYAKKDEMLIVSQSNPTTPPTSNGQMHYNKKDNRMFIAAK